MDLTNTILSGFHVYDLDKQKEVGFFSTKKDFREVSEKILKEKKKTENSKEEKEETKKSPKNSFLRTFLQQKIQRVFLKKEKFGKLSNSITSGIVYLNYQFQITKNKYNSEDCFHSYCRLYFDEEKGEKVSPPKMIFEVCQNDDGKNVGILSFSKEEISYRESESAVKCSPKKFVVKNWIFPQCLKWNKTLFELIELVLEDLEKHPKYHATKNSCQSCIKRIFPECFVK